MDAHEKQRIAMDAKTAAMILNIPVRRIYVWNQRGIIRPARRDAKGRNLYADATK
jgi:DNA-binding transcriptional MerR regulator